MASWQIDIPGLSQLVLGAGAHGLKQLALSGVDVHTIGCMLMVSELTPASQGFRAVMSARREKQRTERQWLYNLVEIGAGSSFLVDHLLKTRAGENVLALLTSMVPLMSPDACSVVLSILFETAGVPDDHTPGMSQFQKVRTALVTFARNVGFQERVLQYHSLLEKIVTQRPQQATAFDKRSPFDAMPDKHNLPRIINLCHKVSTLGDVAVLVYKGFHGSGWVAAYASFILGFSVCAVDAAGIQIPLSDSYDKAKVILELGAKESTCEVHIEGMLSDFISIEPLDQSSRRSWVVNCAELNFLAYNLPELTDPAHVRIVSEVAAVDTLNEAKERALYIGITDPLPGFHTYFISVLPKIQERSLDILSLLGFKARHRGDYQFDLSSHCEGTLDDACTSKESPPYCISKRAYEVIDRAVSFASQLAFTDWNTSLRTMSARHFHGHPSSGTILRRTVLRRVREPGPFEGLGQALVACTDICDEETLRQRMFTSDWLGLSLDGVVVLRTLLNCHSISKIQGKIFSLLPGHISFEGQQRELIRMAFERDIVCKPITSLQRNVQPTDMASSLRSRLLFSGSGDTLWARHEILDGSELFTVAHPVEISVAIRKMLVAQSCAHPYDTVFNNQGLLRKGKVPVALLAGLTLYKSERPREKGVDGTYNGYRIFYQQVDKNDVAQWLACQWHRGFDDLSSAIILQDDTCLECIIERIIGNMKMFEGSDLQTSQICIIAGRKDDVGRGNNTPQWPLPTAT